jgi:hypothetical protein
MASMTKTLRLLLVCLLALGVLVALPGCDEGDAGEEPSAEEEEASEDYEEEADEALGDGMAADPEEEADEEEATEEPQESEAEEAESASDDPLTPGRYKGVVVASEGQISDGVLSFVMEVDLDDSSENVIVDADGMAQAGTAVEVELSPSGSWTFVGIAD